MRLIYDYPLRDSLHRHELAHPSISQECSLDERPTKRRRACSQCRQSRVRCSGGSPCDHCSQRNIVCVYVDREGKEVMLASNMAGEKSADHQIALIEPPPPGPMTLSAIPRISAPNALLDTANVCMPVATTSPSDTHNDLDNSEQCRSPLDNSPCGGPSRSDYTSINRPRDAALPVHPSEASWFLGHENDLDSPRNTENFLAVPTNLTNWLPFDCTEYLDLDLPDITVTSPFYSSHMQDRPRLDNQQTSLGEEPQPGAETLLSDQEVTVLRAESVPSLSRFHARLPPPRGQYYVDGAGARASRMNKFKHNPHSSSVISQTSPGQASIAGTRTPKVNSDTENNAMPLTGGVLPPAIVIPEVYQELARKASPVHTTPLHGNFASPSSTLPSIEVMTTLVGLYFERFHKIQPFIDRTLLSTPAWGWCLCLATAAIGASYSTCSELKASSDSLSQILHQLLTREVSDPFEVHTRKSCPKFQDTV